MKLSSDNYQAGLARIIEILQPYHTPVSEEPSVAMAAKAALRDSYLHWIVRCHERLEFRGVRHNGGGMVSVELKQVYLALQADATNPLERAASRQAILEEVASAVQNGEFSIEGEDDALWHVIAEIFRRPLALAHQRKNSADRPDNPAPPGSFD